MSQDTAPHIIASLRGLLANLHAAAQEAAADRDRARDRLLAQLDLNRDLCERLRWLEHEAAALREQCRALSAALPAGLAQALRDGAMARAERDQALRLAGEREAALARVLDLCERAPSYRLGERIAGLVAAELDPHRGRPS